MADSQKVRIAFIETGNHLLDFAKIVGVSTHVKETIIPSSIPWAFEPSRSIRYFPSFVTTNGAHIPVFERGLLTEAHLKRAMAEAAKALSAPDYKGPVVVQIKPNKKNVKFPVIPLSRYMHQLYMRSLKS